MIETTSLPTGIVTLFLSDVVGSTLLLQALGDEYAAVLDRHRQLLHQAISQHGGREVGRHGDEVFAAFTGSRDAVEAAIAANRALSAEPWPRGADVRVRIGLHTGRPRLHDNNYVGLDVHRAARISAVGNGGQVLLSKEAAEDLEQAGLPPEVTMREIGWHRLKDLRYPELLFDLVVAGMASDFPPIGSLSQRPNNLQEPQTGFVGRAADLAQIEDLLVQSDARLVTLTGIGGAGKTRLALAVGARVVDSFHDGVFQVSLAAFRDPQLVMPAIGQTLGVPEFPGMSVLETLQNRLATSEMLIILDNFEQVMDAAPLVTQLLANTERVKALVTSREALRVRGEHVWPVPPLSYPLNGQKTPLGELTDYESIELFVARVRDFKPDFELTPDNADAVRALTTRLEGLPLAIELAASRMALLTPQALLDRLGQRADILSGNQRDVDPRHQTITNMIDWSYELLAEPERRLLDSLSVFSGGFTVDAAERICADACGFDAGVLEGLESLANKSLLVAETVSGEPRLRMLEMIRTYAGQKLDATPDAGVLRTRHAQHFTALVEEMAPKLRGRDQKEWVVQLVDDADNIRAALEWGLDQPTADTTGRLMTGMLWFWIPHGWFTEGLSWTDRAIEQVAGVESEYERALIHDVAGWLKIFSGDYAGALPHCRKALELFTKFGEESDIARTKMTLGITGAVTGEIEEGPAMIMEALAMYQALGDAHGTALALIALGEGARAGGDRKTAEECYLSALDLLVEAGNVYWQCNVLHNLAHFRLHDGDWAAAFEMAGEALRLGEEYGFPMVVNLSIAALGGVAVGRGDARLAAQLFGATDKLLSDLGASFEPLDLAELEQNTEAARSQLPDDVFAAAFEAGRAWTLDEAISAASRQNMASNPG